MLKNILKNDIPKNVHEELKVYPEFFRRLLFYRDSKTLADAENFINPTYSPHDPFLMKGMEKATLRIMEAIKKSERITIFADYDADGVPGAVVLNDFFKKINYENFDVYIPDRHSEGFGLNNDAVKEISERGTKLIVTVDCGIADASEVDLANKLDMDVVVTDHHTPTGKIPKAFAVVDPKQDGCEYPFKDLCGAGVAFKLVEAMIKKIRSTDYLPSTTNFPLGWEKWLLDMVAIATLSDMVPLKGENRIFAYYGLKVLRIGKRPGLNALFNILNIDKRKLSEDDVVFSISPRINAASRMGNPMDAFRLLTAKDENEAMLLAKVIEKMNNERKLVVAQVSKEIKHLAKERDFSSKKIIVVGKPSWKPALLGLVAGNIAEEYNCPVFLWGQDTETTFKGSCRSGGNVNILDLMNKAKDFFVEFGGHKKAGGFSVSYDNVHKLEEILNEALLKCDTKEEKTDEKDVADGAIDLKEFDETVFSHIDKLAPFGEGNPKPLFLISSAKIENVKPFGKNGLHTSLRLFRGDDFIEAISFFNTPDSFIKPLNSGDEISMFVHIEKSNFRGNSSLRLRIKDIF